MGCRAEVHLEADRAAATKDAQELCRYQISQQLSRSIQRVAVVAGLEAYPSWSAYAAAFTLRGGVLEACASGASHAWSLCRAVLCCQPAGLCLVKVHLLW